MCIGGYMSLILKKRSKKAGLPPGSLVHIGEIIHPEVTISLIDYDATKAIEYKNISLEECKKALEKPPTTWLNIHGIHNPEVLESIGRFFNLDALSLEDVMNTGQRSKLDDHKEYLFIVLRLLNYNIEADCIEDSQVSFVLGKNYLISFLEDHDDIFQGVRSRLLQGKHKIRSMGADYLCYSLIDAIVDHYFIILENVDRKLEQLEADLIKDPKPQVMRNIQHLKREIVLLRKSVWPLREVINNFRKLETPLIQPTTQLYLHDVYDHTIQAIDTIESFRDIASGMLDVYLSNMSQRMNEIMKVLTVVSTIFVPLTFIASLYGMNFDYMPEIHAQWGYPVTIGIMIIVALCMVFFFRHKKWI